MCKASMQRAVEKAIERLSQETGQPPTRALLARHLKVSRQAIVQWERVPLNHVLVLEAMTGISRHALRPDVYGPLPKGQAAQAAA